MWVYAPVTKTRGLNRRSKRRLKEIFKSATVTVIKKPDHPLRQHYDRLLEAGTEPPNAAISLAIWEPARGASRRDCARRVQRHGRRRTLSRAHPSLALRTTNFQHTL